MKTQFCFLIATALFLVPLSGPANPAGTRPHGSVEAGPSLTSLRAFAKSVVPLLREGKWERFRSFCLPKVAVSQWVLIPTRVKDARRQGLVPTILFTESELDTPGMEVSTVARIFIDARKAARPSSFAKFGEIVKGSWGVEAAIRRDRAGLIDGPVISGAAGSSQQWFAKVVWHERSWRISELLVVGRI